MKEKTLSIKSVVKAYSIREAMRFDMEKLDYDKLKSAPAWHQSKCGLIVLNRAVFDNVWIAEKAMKSCMQKCRHDLLRTKGFVRLMPFEIEDAYDLMVETEMLHLENDEFIASVFGYDAVTPDKRRLFEALVKEFVEKTGDVVEESFLRSNNLYLFLD